MPFRKHRLSLGIASLLLIAGTAVVQPDALFRAPLFRLGEGPKRVPEPAAWSPERRAAPHFLCLVIAGGLRADYARFEQESAGQMHVLDRFIEHSVNFKSVAAQASHPGVSLKSILSGSYPANLILKASGADQRSLLGLDRAGAFMESTFAESETKLGSWLGEHGYQVSAFSDAKWVTGEASFSEKFQAPGRRLSSLGAATRWMRKLPHDRAEQPHALIIHVEELLPRGTRVQEAEAAYRRALSMLDRELGQLIRAVGQQGLWEEGLMVITSDHGTSLGERGQVGSGELYLEQLMVPLGIKFPASWQVPSGTELGAVELVDLLPTLQAICSGTAERSDGRSMLPVALEGRAGRKLLVAQTSLSASVANPTTRCAIEPGNWQLIQDARGDGLLFYRLQEDPAALHPAHPGELQVPRFVTKLFKQRVPE